MTMKWLTILQFLEIVAAYGIVTLFLPWLVLRKRFRRFSAAEQLRKLTGGLMKIIRMC